MASAGKQRQTDGFPTAIDAMSLVYRLYK